MSRPLVSICIPTYNGQTHLVAAIESALAQTYEPVEILIVDDGSTDDTLQIAERYAGKHERCRIVRNEKNLGLVGNWNRCVELAQGEWIKFLFQDDLLAPRCVELLVARAQEDGSRMIGCSRDFIFDDSIDEPMRDIYRLSQQVILDFHGPGRGVTAQQLAHRIVKKINHNYFGEPTVTLIHKSVFDEFGLFNPDLAQLCDLEYWDRVGSQIGLTFVPENLATFRAHRGGTSASNRSSKNFRAFGLDPMFLLARMLDGSEYESLRQIWQRDGLLQAVVNMASNRANEVYEFVQCNADMPFENSTASEAYALFLERLPRYRVSAFEHWLWKIRVTPHRIKYALEEFIARKRVNLCRSLCGG